MKAPYRWNVWLDYIGQQEVIVILGPELMRVQDEGAEVTLDQWIARRLAAKYNMAWPPAQGAATLNRLVSEILCQSNESEAVIYIDIRDLVREGDLRPPEWLRKLARIHDFRLFVTTTFDPLMEMALNEERFQGASRTLVVNNSLKMMDDLPEGPIIPDGTTLVHLMGQMSTPPFFAVTDNDTLEFLCRLQSERTRPPRLFDALRESHLLLLGGNFPDWVDRLLLRLVRSESLAKRRFPTLDTMADTRALADTELEWFMNHFSKPTVIYPDGGGIAFIDALYEKWSSRNPAPATGEPAKPDSPTGPRAIFLSYARQDLEAARELKRHFKQHGLDVWMDEAELCGGDVFERKINQQIDQCALFIPVISRQTEARLEGWFRREWAHALKRLPAMHADLPFIFPVAVDDTRPSVARGVPDEFKRYQWTACPQGLPPQAFIDRLSAILSPG